MTSTNSIKETAEKFNKRKTLLNEKHYTSTIFIVSKELPRRVLLVNHNKFNKWMPPGGHQECFENSFETVIRETLEKTGIDISSYLPTPKKLDERAFSIPTPEFILEETIDPNKNQPKHFHLDMIYMVKVPFQDAKHREEESKGIKWFTLEEIEDLNLFNNVREIIRKVLKE